MEVSDSGKPFNHFLGLNGSGRGSLILPTDVRNRSRKGATPRQARGPELVEWASLRPYAIRFEAQSPGSGFRISDSEGPFAIIRVDG